MLKKRRWNRRSAPESPVVADIPAFDPLTEEGLRIPFVDLAIREPENNQEVALSIQLLILLAVLTLSPSIILLTTCFLRISVVLNFIRQALSLQQVPPQSVLMGIALFLTLFVMWPTVTDVYENSFRPFADGAIGFEEAYDGAEKPIRAFMFRQMAGNHDNIQLFMKLSGRPKPDTAADVPTYVLVPSFILHELTVAFKIGILLYIPFIIIDMVVASTLMSMGMIMLPPVMISLPFKMILFVLVDGWTLITQQIVLELSVGGQVVSVGLAVQIMRSAIFQVLILAAPILTISLLVGLTVSIFQATTSIQEQTLTFVPKIAAIFSYHCFFRGVDAHLHEGSTPSQSSR